MIAKDIQALLSEKIQLEKESQSTDYNMSVKKTEQHSLQSVWHTCIYTETTNESKRCSTKKIGRFGYTGMLVYPHNISR